MKIVIAIFFVMLSGLLFAQQPDTLFRATANIYNYSASPFAGAEYRIFLSVNDLRGEPDISEIQAMDVVVDGNCTFWSVKNVHVGGFGASGNIVLDVASLSGSQLPSVGFTGAITRYGANNLLGIVQEAPARVNTCITWYNTTVALGSPNVSVIATLADTTAANPNPVQGDVIIKQDTAFVGWYTGDAWRVVYIQTTSGGGGAVSWNDLVDVPPGFADGVDDGILEVISDNTLLGAGIAGDPLKIDTTKAATRLWVQDQLDALPPSGVLSVLSAYGINVDATDPSNPIVSADTTEMTTTHDLSILSGNLIGAIQDTAANIRADIPTNVSELTNDAGYLTTEVDGSVSNEGALTAITVTPLESFSIRSNTAGSSDLTFFLGDNMSGIPLTPNSVTLFADDDQTAAEVPATPFSGVLANNVQGQLEEIQGNIPTVPTVVSAFTNDAGYLTSEVDGSTTNEGLLSVSAAGANAAKINSNTAGSPSAVIKGGANSLISISGDTIIVASTGGSGGGGTVESVTANAPATVNNTDPANPIVGVDTTTAGTGLATRGHVASSIAALDIPSVNVLENYVPRANSTGGLVNSSIIDFPNRVVINKSVNIGGAAPSTDPDLSIIAKGLQPFFRLYSNSLLALAEWGTTISTNDVFFDAEVPGAGLWFRTANNTRRFVISGNGNIGIGSATNPGYILDISGTNAVKFPVGTTAQRPTGVRGVLRSNSTHGGFDLHDGIAYRRMAAYTDATPSDGQQLVYSTAEGAFVPTTVSAGTDDQTALEVPFDGGVEFLADNVDAAIREVQGNIPTAVSELTNDAGYLTAESQTLSIVGNDLSISSGNTVTLPVPAGDNLGNHTATQDIYTGANAIRRDVNADAHIFNTASTVAVITDDGTKPTSHTFNQGQLVYPTVDNPAAITGGTYRTTVIDQGLLKDALFFRGAEYSVSIGNPVTHRILTTQDVSQGWKRTTTTDTRDSDETIVLNPLEVTLPAGAYRVEYHIVTKAAGAASGVNLEVTNNYFAPSGIGAGSYIGAVGDLENATGWGQTILPSYGDNTVKITKLEGFISSAGQMTITAPTLSWAGTPLDTITIYPCSVRWEKIQ